MIDGIYISGCLCMYYVDVGARVLVCLNYVVFELCYAVLYHFMYLGSLIEHNH